MARFERELRQAVTPVPARDLLSGTATRHALAGPRWCRTARGHHVPATAATPTPAQLILDAVAVLPPGAVIGGWAAAHALGADLLDGLDDGTLAPRPVPVYLPPGLHRRDVAGLR